MGSAKECVKGLAHGRMRNHRMSPEADGWLVQMSSTVCGLWVLGVPARTAHLERLFSAAGRAVNKRRPRLKKRRAARFILAHANIVRGIDGSRARAKRKQAA